MNLVKGRIGFNTLIIGGNQQAINIYNQVKDNPKVLGNIFHGFIYSNKEASNGMTQYLPQLGHLSQLEDIIDKNHIEEVIVAVDCFSALVPRTFYLKIIYNKLLCRLDTSIWWKIIKLCIIKNV